MIQQQTIVQSNGIRKAAVWAVAAVMSLSIALPVIASAADSSGTTNISVGVGDVISLSTDGAVSFSLIPTAGGVVSSGSDVVRVSTNNVAGYVLSLSNNDSNTSLVSGSNTIGAHAGTYIAPSVLANGTWGYAVAGGAFDASYSAETNNASSTTKWAGVPALASPQTIKNRPGVASNDQTTVWYGARVSNGQGAGTYIDTVTYTATTN